VTWLRPVVEERLEIVPDEIESGHCPALSRPAELATRLLGDLDEAWELESPRLF
jgi:hypothetical protein